MDNDMVVRRTEHLTPAGREVLVEMRRAVDTNDQSAIPAIVERLRGLPPTDQAELTELIGLLQHGSETEITQLEAGAAAAEEGKRVILAANDKLRSEGKPVDPGMTVKEAYEILRHPTQE